MEKLCISKVLAIHNFNEMIKKSWTYARLTQQEKDNWEKTLREIRTDKALKGTYKQRWEILNAIYGAYINALGYEPIGWRETEQDIATF